MKNKLISIMLIAVVILMMITTNSLADTEKVVGSLNIDHGIETQDGETVKEIPKDTEIKVTLNASKTVYGVEFRLLFDDELFEYVSNSDEENTIVNDQKEDQVKVVYTNLQTADSITLNFKTKKEIKADELKFELQEELFFDQEGYNINQKDEIYPQLQEEKNNSNTIYYIISGIAAVIIILIIVKVLLSKNGKRRK